jgi:hypothetical protein
LRRNQQFRNASPIWFSPTNQDTPREFQAWQCIQYDLDKRLWKAFWGNVLGAEHVRRIGGLQEMQGPGAGEESVSSDLLEQAYAQGLAKLKDCACYQGWRELGDGAVFLSLSPSPLDWFSEEVQARRERLQQALGHVAVGPWDWDAYPSR